MPCASPDDAAAPTYVGDVLSAASIHAESCVQCNCHALKSDTQQSPTSRFVRFSDSCHQIQSPPRPLYGPATKTGFERVCGACHERFHLEARLGKVGQRPSEPKSNSCNAHFSHGLLSPVASIHIGHELLPPPPLLRVPSSGFLPKRRASKDGSPSTAAPLGNAPYPPNVGTQPTRC